MGRMEASCYKEFSLVIASVLFTFLGGCNKLTPQNDSPTKVEISSCESQVLTKPFQSPIKSIHYYEYPGYFRNIGITRSATGIFHLSGSRYADDSMKLIEIEVDLNSENNQPFQIALESLFNGEPILNEQVIIKESSCSTGTGSTTSVSRVNEDQVVKIKYSPFTNLIIEILDRQIELAEDKSNK